MASGQRRGVLELRSLVLGLTACLLVGAAQPATVAAPEEMTMMVILHDNDIHFNFNRPDAFKKVVEEFRRTCPNVFLLSAGDILVRDQKYWPGQSLDFYAQRSRFMVETMNEVGYDAMTLGNNEVDYRGTITRDSLRLARFPILGANVSVKGEAFDAPRPYVVLTTKDGLTVAVLGLSVGDSPGDVAVSNPIEAARVHRHLRKNNVWILLTHLRTQYDQRLAQQFPEADAIIGGHSAGDVTPAETINGVLYTRLLAQSPGMNPDNPMRLGIVRLYLRNGRVCGKAGEMLTINADGTYMRGLKTPVLAEVKFLKTGVVSVVVRNPLALNALSLSLAVAIEGTKDDASATQALLQPGERRTFDFSLPAGTPEGTVVHAKIDVHRPDDLPEWEQAIDFQPILIRAACGPAAKPVDGVR